LPKSNPTKPVTVANFYASRCGWELKNADKAWKATGKRANEVRGGGRHSLSDDETKAFLSACRANPGPVSDALVFALYTGLRVSELVKAKWTDLQPRDWYGTPRLCLHVLGKGEKWRWVPLDRRAERSLPVRTATYLFPGGSSGHIGAATVQALCKRIASSNPRLSRLTPHVLRHTYATKRVKECVKPEELKEALGHNSLNTTLVYVGSLGFARG
jgi:integrase/recombinase XerD